MHKPKLDDIEIQEPPLEELKKNKSCLRNSCISGCGCLVIFFVGLIILLKIMTNPMPKEIDHIPQIIEQNIPIYDQDNIETVEIISSQRRSQVTNFLLKIPRFIADPIIQTLNIDLQSDDPEKNIVLQEAYQSLEDSLSDERDILIITWLNLDANPDFITDYYKTELKKKGFKVKLDSKFEFTGKKIDGIMYIEDNKNQDGTDKVVITLRIPN